MNKQADKFFESSTALRKIKLVNLKAIEKGNETFPFFEDGNRVIFENWV